MTHRRVWTRRFRNQQRMAGSSSLWCPTWLPSIAKTWVEQHTGHGRGVANICATALFRNLLPVTDFTSVVDYYGPVQFLEGWRLSSGRAHKVIFCRRSGSPTDTREIGAVAHAGATESKGAAGKIQESLCHTAFSQHVPWARGESPADERRCTATNAPSTWAATTSGTCELMQSVNLIEAAKNLGCPEDLATIMVDCGMPLQLKLLCGGGDNDDGVGQAMLLLDNGTEPLPPYHSGRIFPHNRHWLQIRDSSDFEVGAGTWREVSLTAHDYPAGVRRATVIVRGSSKSKDPSAGHAGLRLGLAALMFLPAAVDCVHGP